MRLTYARLTPLLVVAALVCSPRGAAAQPPGGGEAPAAEAARALDAVVKEFTSAFDRGDARAVAALFTEDAEVADESGATVRGREAIAEHFARAFAEAPRSKIELTVESRRFLGPDAAWETGRARVVPPEGGPPERSRYTTLYIRRDGRWLQDRVSDEPDPAPTPHERLQELAWLVGEWVDEGETGVVHTTCRWSDDRNFLVREFTLRFRGRPAMAGTQRIGWDARAGQFRSWVFDADGGHSEGLWNRDGKGRWVVKATGVLADGRAVSATQVLTSEGPALARWQSIDRAVGGEVLPDQPEVVLVRVPPKPASAARPAEPNPTSNPTPSPPRKP